jgi:hypothetical protein
MSGVQTNCRVGKPGPSRVVHTHEFPGSNPAPATSIAGGAGSRLTLGDQTGGARLPRRDEFQIAGGASSSRPSGDDAVGPRGMPDGQFFDRDAARPDIFSIHISADTAALLELLAAERGERLADAIARLTVEEIERKGGIAHV